jgi:hypothetical protein
MSRGHGAEANERNDAHSNYKFAALAAESAEAGEANSIMTSQTERRFGGLCEWADVAHSGQAELIHV